ncbi:MAG: amidohydrolase family protein [Gammaproteobacteria bacterium]|nr:amidohydrolase family protein [Gammaproteobacteria bacterium]
MRSRVFAFCTLFLICAWTVRAETILIRAERMLDVDTGKFISPVVVLVDGNRVAAVNPEPLPPVDRTIELERMTLLPGFMDLHTHLTDDKDGNWVYRNVERTPVDAALLGVKYARMTLLTGFTTVRDVGSSGFADVALMRAINGGIVEGPRIIPAGHSVGVTGGHCDVTGYAPGILEQTWREGVADGPDEIAKAIRYQAKHGAGVIKICATAGVLSFTTSLGALQYSEEELRTAVATAHVLGLKIAAHAHGPEGIIAASNAGVDSIEHGSLLTDEAIAALKKNGTWLVPTLYQWFVPVELPPLLNEKNEYIKARVGDSMRRAIKAGVKFAFGTDAGAGPHGRGGEEFTALVEHGMTPLEAIRTATINAAEMMSLDDRGRIRAGLLADLVAVAGDPLENIRLLEDVKFVMKDGKVYMSPD